MLIKEEEITEKWENYFDRFYNESDTWDWSELSKSTENRNCCPLRLCTGRVGWGQYIEPICYWLGELGGFANLYKMHPLKLGHL